MTPAILAALKPHLSLYQLTQPDADAADPVVRAALEQLHTPASSLAAGAFGVVELTVEARTDDGGRFIRQAVVRLGGGGRRGYTLLTWERVDAFTPPSGPAPNS
jgi:hypothetical protein